MTEAPAWLETRPPKKVTTTIALWRFGRKMHFFVPLLPPRALSPNARLHWSVKAGVVKDYRNAVRLMASNAVQTLQWPVPVKARVKLTFVYKSPALRDPDNALASFKAGLDGLVDGGVIIGDDSERLTIEPVEIVVNRRLESGVHIVVEAV